MVKNLQRDSGALSTETKTLASAQQRQAKPHTLSARMGKGGRCHHILPFQVYLRGFGPQFFPLCGKEPASHSISLAQGTVKGRH